MIILHAFIYGDKVLLFLKLGVYKRVIYKLLWGYFGNLWGYLLVQYCNVGLQTKEKWKRKISVKVEKQAKYLPKFSLHNFFSL